jgi:hypothetical protein
VPAEAMDAHATIADKPNMSTRQSCTAIMPIPAARHSPALPA